MSNEVIEHSISYIQHLLDNVFEKTDNVEFFLGIQLKLIYQNLIQCLKKTIVLY